MLLKQPFHRQTVVVYESEEQTLLDPQWFSGTLCIYLQGQKIANAASFLYIVLV